MKAEQRERHPLRRRGPGGASLTGAVRREAEGEAGADSRRTSKPVSRRPRRKAKNPESAYIEQEGRFVGGDRVDATQLQRGCDDAQAEQVFGQRHRSRHRPHHRRFRRASLNAFLFHQRTQMAKTGLPAS